MSRRKKPTSFDQVVFFKEFSNMISASIPLIKACELLKCSQENPYMQDLVSHLKQQLLMGSTLTQAFSQHSLRLHPLVYQLLYLGESTGTLTTCLTQVSSHLENRYLFRQQIKKNLFYPALVALTGIVVCLWMLIVIIPHFAELFSDKTDELPWISQLLFSTSSLLHGYAVELLALIASLAVIGTYYIKQYTQPFKQHLLKIAEHIPAVKPILHFAMLSQFTDSLKLCLSAGLSISQALPLCTPSHPLFAQDIKQLGHQIDSGLTIHQSMEKLKYFPAIYCQMIHTAEESGTLEATLGQLAAIYRSKFENSLQYAGQLLEPLVIIGLGVLIGGLVISMYLPVFKLGNVL